MIASDQMIREQALDYRQSFIVQAPAGSGKTELLTQRFLALLAHVERVPEEVIAITFTKKAAAEMRSRIIQALRRGLEGVPPNEPHALQTWRLSREVILRNQTEGWDILNNSHRLRVTTIDALCASITQNLPILSRFGDQPEVSEEVSALYRQAIKQLLADLDHDLPWQRALSTVLLHLDNNLLTFESLMIGMLKRREQWLDVLPRSSQIETLRQSLEETMENVGLEALEKFVERIPKSLINELSDLIAFAFAHLPDCEYADLSSAQLLTILSEPSLADLPVLISIADLLVKADGYWRSSVNVKQGFPAKSNEFTQEQNILNKAYKDRMIALLESLPEYEIFRQNLNALEALPPKTYTAKQWDMVSALLTILPVLVAHLRVIFAAERTVDFNEVALSALQALGDEDSPSELALALDYRIRHLLVDEFQDTSQLQYRLLQGLTRGWQAGDGRTLFLVGDPMQSIYRFRQADVSLFRQVQLYGINQISLQYLRLEANFRSDPTIIAWVNTVFPNIFPVQDDHLRGAICYSSSVAMKSAIDRSCVKSFFVVDAQEDAQAKRVLTVVQETLMHYKEESIAILVRSRGHLQAILPALQKAKIPYQAVDIESLAERAIIHDLLALSYALTHLADRLSWLSILRAPWSGLDLHDLHYIAKASKQSTIWEALPTCLPNLSISGQKIVQRLMPVLKNCLAERDRLPIRRLVEKAWWALSGPESVMQKIDLHNVEVFFDLLENEAKAGRMPSRHDFMARLSHLKACSEPSSSSKVQVMTIHKAKGLEFDTVIIPGLERATRGEDQAMLLWQELIDKTGQHRLLLAPIKSAGEKADQMYRYLYINEQEKSAFEAQRLLYVAVTRAKKRLYLFATVEQDEAGGIKSPPKRSQLASLWSTLQNECEDQVSTGSIPSVESLNPSFKTSFNRLPTDWQLSGVESFFAAQKPVVEGLNIPDPFLPETNLVRAIGTVVHLYLAQISLEGLHDWTAIAIHSRQEIMKAQLRSLGVLAHDLDAAVNEVLRILNFSVDDQRGRWVLSAHAQAKSEYALMSKMNGKLCKFIIDRTFIDEQGRRWIIDYKSSRPTNSETIAAFLAREKQTYLSQLNTYARLLMKQDPKLSIVHCGLYFPALEKGWVSWEYTSF